MRIARSFAMTVILLIGSAAIAFAHATLRRADPPDGGRVSRPPRELRLEFSEAVTARTSRIDLLAPDSQRFALDVEGDTAMANVLLAHVPQLPMAGLYRVEWRLVGADGHGVTGHYGFTVDSVPAPAKAVDTTKARPVDIDEPPADPLTAKVIRFASSMALVTIIGSIAFGLFVLPMAAINSTVGTGAFVSIVDLRLRSLGSVATWSLLAVGLTRLVNHGVTLSGSLSSLTPGDLGDLVTGSAFGRGWILQMLAGVALLVAWRQGRPARWRLLAGLTLPLAVSAALLGHPAAIADVPVLAVGLDATHVLGASGWAGSILALSFVAIPQVMRSAADERLPLARGLLRSFSPLALACAALVLITGAGSAWLQLRDVGLLFDSPYGLALVRKVVVVVIIAALGLYHWRVARPSLESEPSLARLRMSLAGDAALIVIVLILTAVLTGTPPR